MSARFGPVGVRCAARAPRAGCVFGLRGDGAVTDRADDLEVVRTISHRCRSANATSDSDISATGRGCDAYFGQALVSPPTAPVSRRKLSNGPITFIASNLGPTNFSLPDIIAPIGPQPN